MSSLGTVLSHLATQMDQDSLQRHVNVRRNNDAYAHAVARVCGKNVDMADLILAHTNAVYIRRDDVPRKGPDRDKPYIVCEVCIDDPVVRSEVNMRQELLRLALMYENIHFDEFRIIPAKGRMRRRHPFERYTSTFCEEEQFERTMAFEKGRADLQDADRSDLLEIVKRAFCLVLGTEAEAALKLVNGADITPLGLDVQGEKRDGACVYWLSLYSSRKAELELRIREHEQTLVSRAHDLMLNLRGFSIQDSDDSMNDKQAFPPCGNPVPLSADERRRMEEKYGRVPSQ